jgi:hypothetical protein
MYRSHIFQTMKALALVSVGIFAAVSDSRVQAIPDDLLQVQLVVRPEINSDELLRVQVRLRNVGKSELTLPRNMAPEGWLIKLRVCDHSGAVIYGSPTVKIEMTAAELRKFVGLGPQAVRDVEFVVKQLFPVGDYVLGGTFSTQVLAGRQLTGLPTGSWTAAQTTFKVRSK